MEHIVRAAVPRLAAGHLLAPTGSPDGAWQPHPQAAGRGAQRLAACAAPPITLSLLLTCRYCLCECTERIAAPARSLHVTCLWRRSSCVGDQNTTIEDLDSQLTQSKRVRSPSRCAGDVVVRLPVEGDSTESDIAAQTVSLLEAEYVS